MAGRPPGTFCETEKPKECNPLAVAPTNSYWTTSLEEQIEEITHRIEATDTGITATYIDWLRLGFSFVETLDEGAAGHTFTVSADSSLATTHKKPNNCLKPRLRSRAQKILPAGQRKRHQHQHQAPETRQIAPNN